MLPELVMTFFLVTVVYGTAVDQRAPKIAGFGIGMMVLTDVLIGGPFTRAAMNPARAMGPMIAGLFSHNVLEKPREMKKGMGELRKLPIWRRDMVQMMLRKRKLRRYTGLPSEKINFSLGYPTFISSWMSAWFQAPPSSEGRNACGFYELHR